MPYLVQVTHVEPQPTAVVRRLARADQLSTVVPQGCGEVWKFISAAGLPRSVLNMALYRDSAINLECGVVLHEPATPTPPVVASQTPGGLVATAVHHGPYSRLGAAHQAITQWCAANGYTPAGPNWEIYDHWNDDPEKLRTDVFYLLNPAGSPAAAPSA